MSVNKKYSDILDYLVQPKTHSHSGDKTICYLTFSLNQIQQVKQQLNEGWLELAKHKGLEPVLLSLHEVLKDFFLKDENRVGEGENSVFDEYQMKELYDSLGENLRSQNILEQAILNKQIEVKNKKNGVLIITDVEAIHPFTRFGPIEHKIYDKVEVPIIVLYPGEISGSALKFLGFYTEDGNYRSKHF